MTVYLVGAGPGDPGLITVKGKELLSNTQAVIYDRLANSELLKNVPKNAEMVSAGKGPGFVDLTQDEINQCLVDLANKYDHVVRLKGGDPFVFGRGGEEAQYLIENNIDFEIVPGITSAIAAPAYAGIPVTQRALATNFTVVTGHEDPAKEKEQVKWENLAKIDGTLVVLMGVGNRGKIAEALIAGGKDPNTSVAIVREGTLPSQNISKTVLSDLAETYAVNPSIIVIGPVADMGLSWFETKPLFGKKIVVTRSRDQQSKISIKLNQLGAQVIEASAIEIQPIDFDLPDIANTSHVIFTSTNGVEITMKRLFDLGLDSRHFNNIKIAAIGSATAEELKKYGIVADMVPKTFVAEELVELFPDAAESQNKIICFRASKVRDALEVGLTSKGYDLINVDVYNTLISNVDEQTLEHVKYADAITFASSSTVENSIKLFGKESIETIPVKISIGPVTTSTMRENNIEPTVQASQHTIDGIIDALLNVFDA
ncbi:MAG: uroporphyrinogen-III C-methyltransferase [Acidimicrobiia bacterium]